MRGRREELIVTCGFVIIFPCLCFTYLKDKKRDECVGDKRFIKMEQICNVILFVALMQTLYISVRGLVTCQ